MPTTLYVTPLAHLVFKVVWANMCLRVGNRSNFTYQDLIVISMILSGKPFDTTTLLLRNMINVITQKKTGFRMVCC